MTALANDECKRIFCGDLDRRKLLAALAFVLAALGLSWVAPSIEIAWVSAFLLLTVYLFAFEVVGVDVAAVSILVLLGLTALLLGTIGLVAGYFPARTASRLDPVVAMKL